MHSNVYLKADGSFNVKKYYDTVLCSRSRCRMHRCQCTFSAIRSFRNTLPATSGRERGEDSENRASSREPDNYIVKYIRRRNYGAVGELGWP